MFLEGDHRQHGGQTGGTHGHRVPGGQPLRQRHQPFRLNAGFLGVAAPPDLTHAPARQHHLVAGFEALVARRLHGAGEIDAGHVGIGLHQPAPRTDAQAVLVIQGGVLHRDGNVAVGQPRFLNLLHRGAGFAVFVLVYDECVKSHGSVSQSEWRPEPLAAG